MASVNVIQVLNRVYGVRGLPFPQKPSHADAPVIAGGFITESHPAQQRSSVGTPVKKYSNQDLGQYEFLPATINGIAIPNALVMISGEKSIVETDIVDVGTVFEKVFTRPYDITIIATLTGDNQWPELELKQLVDLWKKDDLVTLKCALTDLFIQDKNNLVLTAIAMLDAEGSETTEVIQFTGRSNIDFELELI
jgi:hypothetical protein